MIIVKVNLTLLQTLRELLGIDASRSDDQTFHGTKGCRRLTGIDLRDLIVDRVETEELLIRFDFWQRNEFLIVLINQK